MMDSSGEIIEGTLYRQELSPVMIDDRHVYAVEKVLKTEQRLLLLLLLLLLLSAAPIQGSPQRMFSNICTEDLAVFYAGCPS